MARLDLHLHSTHSDGLRSPAWVDQRAAANGAEVIALTDHDTLAGVTQAVEAGRNLGLRVIPGVELGVHTPALGELHVLGYFPAASDGTDPHLTAFEQQLTRYRDERGSRAEVMISRLKELGCPIDPVRVTEIAGGGSIGRPHIARALVEAGHVASVQEAFDRYLHNDGPAYVARQLLGLERSVELIHAAGGLASLAHPSRHREPEAAMDTFAAAAGDAIEVFYRNDDAETIARGLQRTRSHRLLATVGSDWHGLNEAEREPASVAAPDHAVEQVLEAFARLESEAPG